MNKPKLIYDKLFEAFGPQSWWPYTDEKNKELEVAIGAILTQNTNWQNVEKAISNLRIQKLLSSKKLEKINVKRLAALIKPSGYYNQKAKKIKAFIKFLESGKKLNRDNLLSVWGVGPETADSILLYAYNQPIFVIDAYTKRIINRLGFKEKTYDELQKLFMQNLPKDAQLYNEFHALLVKLGKDFCKTKPQCQNCPITSMCKTKVS